MGNINIESNFKPYKKQQEILSKCLDNKHKNICICTGRQVGKTLLSIYLSIYYLFSEKNSDIGFITPVYKTGKKIFRDLVKYISSSDVLRNICEINNSEMHIIVNKKNIIRFFSAERYDNIRGNTFTHLIIDEAAFIKNEAYDSAIKPTTIVKCKKVIMFSTPKGKNWFFNLYNKPTTVRFNFSSWENPYIDRQTLEDFKKEMPEKIYEQEILGIFLDDGSEVFKNFEYLKTPLKINSKSNKYFCGIDIAQANDYTVITIINEFGEILEIERFNKLPYDKIITRIIEILNKYPKVITYLEVNNVGSVVYDMLIKDRRLEQKKIYPFTTTNQSKTDIIEILITDIQNQNIKSLDIPHLKTLISEMETFTFIYSIHTRMLKYEAMPTFHDDCVISLALANKARKNTKSTTKPQIFLYGN